MASAIIAGMREEEAQYHLAISGSRAQLPVHWATSVKGTQLVYWLQLAGESVEL